MSAKNVKNVNATFTFKVDGSARTKVITVCGTPSDLRVYSYDPRRTPSRPGVRIATGRWDADLGFVTLAPLAVQLLLQVNDVVEPRLG